jgi:DNA-binding protein HU-beta
MAKEIIAQLAEKSNITRKQAEEVYRNVFDLLKESLKEGESVRIHGFGSFTVKERAKREGRNPSTGKPITIPACKTVAFKLSEAFKQGLNE